MATIPSRSELLAINWRIKMQCSCGGITRNTAHLVTTEKFKKEWGVTSNDPVIIEQDKCDGCGRLRVKIVDLNGNMLLTRG